jgi:pimeloyl-ACP methyl ester carboxylesterase
MVQRALDVAPSKFVLIGHSMGGRVALDLVRQAPDRVIALALLDTSYLPWQDDDAGRSERQKRLGLLEQARAQGMRVMGRQWLKGMIHPARQDDAVLTESIIAMLERSSLAQYEAQVKALLNRPDSSKVLGNVSVPVLSLCGREDTWTNVHSHREMARMAQAGEFVEIPNCGHMAPMEQPAAVSAALRNWISKMGTFHIS